MSTDIILDEGKYISSKRASEMTGYAQDYIGQLSRGSLIDARRIGGLWYVSMDSLLAYKNKSEEVKQKVSTDHVNTFPDADSFVHLDGKEYISASRASKITGYNQDYVGQLARGGKVMSRQVGNRWYVDKSALLAHKQEKDSLLAAVQVQSVGIAQRHTPTEVAPKNPYFQDELLTYTTDEGDLIPSISEEELEEENEGVGTDEEHAVPIRVVERYPRKEIRLQTAPTRRTYGPERSEEQNTHEKTIHKAIIPAFALVVVLVISVGFFSFQKRTPVPVAGFDIGGTEANSVVSNTEKSTLVAEASTAFDGFISRIEKVLTRELDYNRGE
ncbi:hypothetical protein HZC00_00295 [Candidatus Kaiserbacteria bacterium]|nr:hypothetical protein [Candidatus Kaiserbacteria bacterium]